MRPMGFDGEALVDTACLQEMIAAFSALFPAEFALLDLAGEAVFGTAFPVKGVGSAEGWLEWPSPQGLLGILTVHAAGEPRFLLVGKGTDGGEVAQLRPVMERLQGLLEAAIRKELQLEGLAHETLLRYEELNLLYEMGESIISDMAIDDIVERMLGRAIESTDASGGVILLFDDDGALASSPLVVKAARGWQKERVPKGKGLSLEQGIVANAIAQRRPQIHADILDESLYGQPGHGIRLKSLLTIPLSTTARLLGGMVLVNKRGERYFTASDEKLGLAVATQAAIAIENNRLQRRIRDEERIGANLQRYVSPNVMRAVLERGGLQELIGDRWLATILFVDIRDFSVVVENTPPAIMITVLNEYFCEVTEIIFRHHGAIDEFAGDELLAFFGIPFATPRGAEDAIRAGVEIAQKLAELQADWKRRGLPVLDAGLGMNTGWVAVGNIGSERRMELTVIGPPVVNASRVEEQNKELGTRILITKETLDEVEGIVRSRYVGSYTLKGISRPIEVYEVMGLREAA